MANHHSGSCPMLSSVLSWHLNRRNQNYILDLPAFNQGAFTLRKFTAAPQCSHSPPVHGAFWLFVSSTIELSCLHWSTLEMFMWCKSSPRVPCTNASRHKWNKNNSGVTFLLPQLSRHMDHQVCEALIAQVFPSSRNLQCCQAPWPVRGVAKRCKAAGEHQCFGSLVFWC